MGHLYWYSRWSSFYFGVNSSLFTVVFNEAKEEISRRTEFGNKGGCQYRVFNPTDILYRRYERPIIPDRFSGKDQVNRSNCEINV